MTNHQAAGAVQCPKCRGRGKVAAYARVLGGVCFSCNGTGVISRAEAERRAAAEERRTSREQAAAQRRAAGLPAAEAAALARFGDSWRLACALSMFPHPVAQLAANVVCDLRDQPQNAEAVEHALNVKLPRVLDRLGLRHTGLEEIEALAESHRREWQAARG